MMWDRLSLPSYSEVTSVDIRMEGLFAHHTLFPQHLEMPESSDYFFVPNKTHILRRDHAQLTMDTFLSLFLRSYPKIIERWVERV